MVYSETDVSRYKENLKGDPRKGTISITKYISDDLSIFYGVDINVYTQFYYQNRFLRKN